MQTLPWINILIFGFWEKISPFSGIFYSNSLPLIMTKLSDLFNNPLAPLLCCMIILLLSSYELIFNYSQSHMTPTQSIKIQTTVIQMKLLF